MKNKKFTLLLIVLFSLVCLGAFALWNRSNNKTQSPGSGQPQDGSLNTVNYGPATEEDKAAADRNKQEIVKNQENTGNTSTPTNKKRVTPVITIAQQFNNEPYGNRVEVRAFIPGIIEENGKCTVTLTKGDQKLVRSVDGIADATTTRCDTVSIPRTEFPSSGEWTAVVEYSSAKYSGVSEPRKVPVS